MLTFGMAGRGVLRDGPADPSEPDQIVDVASELPLAAGQRLADHPRDPLERDGIMEHECPTLDDPGPEALDLGVDSLITVISVQKDEMQTLRQVCRRDRVAARADRGDIGPYAGGVRLELRKCVPCSFRDRVVLPGVHTDESSAHQ